MTVPPPPLPVPDEQTAPFWAGLASGELLIQRCSTCGAAYMPPVGMCEVCHNVDLGFDRASGRGTIHSFTIVHVARHVAFEPRVPYPIAVVTLDDHPALKMLTNLPGAEPDAIRAGQPVEFVAEEIAPGHVVPQFRIVS